MFDEFDNNEEKNIETGSSATTESAFEGTVLSEEDAMNSVLEEMNVTPMAEEMIEGSEVIESIVTSAKNTVADEVKPRLWVKGLKFVSVAALFGLIAGGVFFGVNYAANKILPTNNGVNSEDIIRETTGITVNKIDAVQSDGMVIMDVSQVVENAIPSVVAFNGTVTQSYMLSPFFGGNYEQEVPVSGSGIIIGQNDKELLLVTNAHVVDGVNDIKVTFVDGAVVPAVVKGSKSNKDIAVAAVNLKDIPAETLKHIAVVEVGDSDALKMGQPVIAIGNALGEGQSSNVGWISGLNRNITIDGNQYDNLIMTDAAINHGNSGGALLNIHGQLIGITSAKNAGAEVEGMGYAIPISSVEDIINNLMNKVVREKVSEDRVGYLGITGLDITASISSSYGWPEGALITKVSENSPAQKAGLFKNDIIYAFDGEDVSSFEGLRDLMGYYAEGETVKIDYYRIVNGEYEKMSAEVTLGNRSKEQ